ncbi:hypothetical protein ACFYZN_34175 [Streptomyces sp. NPDC001777]|uniref:hypothetical protein n=1 Tax=Streptomyces sp. NPDC001777 TaxID=3364608 RepID=UPI0036A06557
MCAFNLRAAQQYHAREGHLHLPRKRLEHLETDGVEGRLNDADGGVVVKLGTWLDDVRERADELTEQRRADPAAAASAGRGGR